MRTFKLLKIKSYLSISFSGEGATIILVLLSRYFNQYCTRTNTTASPVSSNTTSTLTGDSKNKLGALSVLVRVEKSYLHVGDKETIIIRVGDKNSSNAITSVSERITSPSGPFKKVEGTTDNKGNASYSCTVSNEDTRGKYKLIIEVSASGYKKYLALKTFSVTPISVTVYGNTNNNPPPSIIPSA